MEELYAKKLKYIYITTTKHAQAATWSNQLSSIFDSCLSMLARKRLLLI